MNKVEFVFDTISHEYTLLGHNYNFNSLIKYHFEFIFTVAQMGFHFIRSN